MWTARRLDTVLPNNKKIVNSIQANQKLLLPEDVRPFVAFKNHAIAYEAQVFRRVEFYPLFPKEFAERFSL
jgi:hypothetical protein